MKALLGTVESEDLAAEQSTVDDIRSYLLLVCVWS